MDFDTVAQAIDGICGLFERKLKELNPNVRNISYDITDLYKFIDGQVDMSALVYVSFSLKTSIEPLSLSILCAVLV